MMKALIVWISLCGAALSAQSTQTGVAVTAADVSPLSKLIQEAQQNNPEIRAMAHSYAAASRSAGSAGALPDTQIMLQHLSVGSPRPFAGYTNSDFAYIGLGASQELPWPGKRKLRSQAAALQADVAGAEAGAVSRTVMEQLKVSYYRLAYLQQTIAILERDGKLLSDMEETAESRYRVGKASQQEVLKAQLQRTRLLQDITRNKSEQAVEQTQIKRLLGRPQNSADIMAEPLRERVLPDDLPELFREAAEKNPEIAARKASAALAGKMVELAHKEFRPDFGVQYMYQNTDRRFRDYYMATFTVTLPNRGRRRAELAQALEEQQAAGASLDAEMQRRMADIAEQYQHARESAEQLKIYREGLMPQAEATFRAAMAAYQSNRQDFETLLSSFRDVLQFEQDYQKQLSEHESALARLESLTGVTLP